MKFLLPPDWKIIQPANSTELELYYGLRYEVLRKPWSQDKQSTMDEWENMSVHFLLLNESMKAIATGRLQLNSPVLGQIRSMAVHPDYQKMGIGNFMINILEKEAVKRGIKTMELDAREPALPFYLKNNYSVVADSYLLFGIIKHFKMKKDLDKLTPVIS